MSEAISIRVIFSRKGFDDSYGGAASPILPDATLLSLPIPVAKKEEKGTDYAAIRYGNTHLQAIMEALGIWAKLPEDQRQAHFDPDLRPEAFPDRKNGWQPAFGQAHAAATHLHNTGVGIGDVFLFFGSFKRTYREGTRLQFEKDYPRHIIFGYLKVTAIYRYNQLDEVPQALRTHPHIMNQKEYKNCNTLYLGEGGTFKYRDELVLTRPGFSKSRWQLPGFFHPKCGTVISRHENATRFRWLQDGSIQLNTVGIGQDFVVSGGGLGGEAYHKRYGLKVLFEIDDCVYQYKNTGAYSSKYYHSVRIIDPFEHS